MLSQNLEQTLHRAMRLAGEREHEYATLEHLLLGLIDDPDAAAVLRASGVDLEILRTDVTRFLDVDLAGLATGSAGDPKPTAGFSGDTALRDPCAVGRRRGGHRRQPAGLVVRRA